MRKSLFLTTKKASNHIRDLATNKFRGSTDREMYETIYAINCTLDAMDGLAKAQDEILEKLRRIEDMNKRLFWKLEEGAR